MKYKMALAVCLLPMTASAVDFSFNGFGSIVAGSVIDGDGYIAQYPNLGVYEDGVEFSPETRLGVQGKAAFNDKLSATAQLTTRGADNYDVEVEWLYLSYKLTPNTDIQVGRLRLPVYYFSDYMDVGYAYPWLRIPADTYSLDATNYNGFKYNARFNSGDAYYTLSLYGGEEEADDSELMGYLFESFTTRIDRQFDNLAGVALGVTLEELSVRVTYTRGDMEETQTYAPGSAGVIDYNIEFYDVFARYDFESGLSLMAEYNIYRPFYTSYFTSATYQTGDFNYYISWSKFDLDEPFEEHDTTSIGVRWDLGDTYALKFDLSSMKDDGFNPFSGLPNPVYHNAENGDGDVKVFSVAVDFVF